MSTVATLSVTLLQYLFYTAAQECTIRTELVAASLNREKNAISSPTNRFNLPLLCKSQLQNVAVCAGATGSCNWHVPIAGWQLKRFVRPVSYPALKKRQQTIPPARPRPLTPARPSAPRRRQTRGLVLPHGPKPRQLQRNVLCYTIQNRGQSRIVLHRTAVSLVNADALGQRRALNPEPEPEPP